MRREIVLTTLLVGVIQNADAFTLKHPTTISSSITKNSNPLFLSNEPLNYDDEDFWDEDDEDALLIASLSQNQQSNQIDYSGCSSRQFALGYDIQLTSFAASSGFEEVTDWEYYQDENDRENSVVQPPPLDPNQPKRTREKSGGIVRIFRGELVGPCAAKARSRGLDKRVILKEFSGEFALSLAKTEVEALTKLQSNLCFEMDEGAKNGEWASAASTRYIMGRVNGSTGEDDENLLKWMTILNELNKSNDIPYVGLLGELNLEEFLQDDAENGNDLQNDWYRALKVKGPKPGSLWLVYEFAGLSTLGNYAVPALQRWSSLPPQRSVWGNLQPPPALPQWNVRSKYVVKGILKKSLEALETLHASGITHRSIGRNSILLSSVGQDKTEASSPLATVIPRLTIKLSDFGFAGRIMEASNDEEFRRRARAFKLDLSTSLESKSFAIAEDLHAMGFVFIALLLSSLAEVPTAAYKIPPTDEDSLQRLMTDIFDKDMSEFRDYCEAEDVWSKVVDLLDENNGAGWDVLENMIFARERVVENIKRERVLTAEGLLSSPFFS